MYKQKKRVLDVVDFNIFDFTFNFTFIEILKFYIFA